MKPTDRFSLSQLLALCSVMALTPALRLLPNASAALAGRAGWLSILLALPLAAGYGVFLWHFAQKRREDETLPALWQRAAGEKLGAVLLGLCGLWLLFYAAFTLRDAAQRLIVTVYPHADRRLFALPLGLAAAIAGARDARRLVRTAKLVLPLLVGVIVLTLCFALPEMRVSNLFPITSRDALPLLFGMLPTLDVAALVLTLLFFFSDGLTGQPHYSPVALRVALLGGLMAALTAAVIGSFGHELTARLTQPYFSLVRNLVFFHSLERIEALVVALWIFSDFLLTATLLLAARRAFAPLLGKKRWLSAAVAVPTLLLACLLAPEAEAFAQLSLRLVPAANAAVCLLLIPGVYVLGRLRKKL